MAKVKICGITSKDDAVWALNYGADYLGINLWKESKRHVHPKVAADIVGGVPPFAKVVGVFVNATDAEVVKAVKEAGFKGVQLHGTETPADVLSLKVALQGAGLSPFLVKAIRVENADSLKPADDFGDIVDYFLLDAFVPGEPGGTGKTFDWKILNGVKLPKPFFLAGGLTPNNVSAAVHAAAPFAVDVASGVESQVRKKSAEKMRDFIRNAKQ